jgi:hypothetical protein
MAESIEHSLLALTNNSNFYRFILPLLRKAKKADWSWGSLHKDIYSYIKNNIDILLLERSPDGNTKLFYEIISHYSEEAFDIYVPVAKVKQYIYDSFEASWQQKTLKILEDEISQHLINAEESFAKVNAALQEGKTMKPNDVIQRKVYIFNADASTLTDDQLFTNIADVEAEINRLRNIASQPKALKKRITEMEDALKDVIGYMDERSNV